MNNFKKKNTPLNNTNITKTLSSIFCD